MHYSSILPDVIRLADEASGVPDMTPSPADFVTAKFIEAR